MNKEKASGYPRLIVTFLVAVILLFALGLVADGWQDTAVGGGDGNEEESPEGDAEERVDDTEVDATPLPPKYYNPLTALECTEEISKKNHIAYTIHSNLPFYGVSDCDMMIEFPTEGGQTRLLVLTSDFSKYGKIGTLAMSRSYITNIAKSLGAIMLTMGDDTPAQSANLSNKVADISLDKHDGYHYTEYTHYAYTNSSLLNSAIVNLGINMYASSVVNLPYAISNDENEATLGDIKAERIYIPYSISQDTGFSYSSVTKKYTYEKSGIPKKDNITNDFITFNNIFVLFADAVTYEDKNGTVMDIEANKGGEGYFISSGVAMRILWTSSADGLKFTDIGGFGVTVNPGTSYIGYVKSSMTDEVILS